VFHGTSLHAFSRILKEGLKKSGFACMLGTGAYFGGHKKACNYMKKSDAYNVHRFTSAYIKSTQTVLSEQDLRLRETECEVAMHDALSRLKGVVIRTKVVFGKMVDVINPNEVPALLEKHPNADTLHGIPGETVTWGGFLREEEWCVREPRGRVALTGVGLCYEKTHNKWL
jgi:hypothetical protein